MKRLFLLFGALLAAAALGAPVAAAAGSVTVQNQNVTIDFPTKLTFTVDASSDADIQDVLLTLRFPSVARKVKAKLTPGKQVKASVEWNLDEQNSGANGGYLPPGVSFDYTWTITDAAGNKLETQPKTFTISDNRIQWDTVENNTLAIHWYGKDKTFGQQAFDSGVKTLAAVSQELGSSTTGKVNVWLYTNLDDFRTSMPNMNSWTGGRSFGEYRVIILYVAPSELQSVTIGGIQHELTHQVVFDSLGSSVARQALPPWLNEGLATYHQYNGGPMEQFLAKAMQEAIQTDTVPRLKSRDADFPPDPTQAYVSYGLSFSIVEMLIKNYGLPKFQQMYKLFQQGLSADDVFQQVYGTNTDGLDNIWRKSVGLTERNYSNSGLPTAAARPTFSLSSAETPAPKGSATPTAASVSQLNTPAPAAATTVPQSANTTSGKTQGPASTGLCGIGGIALAMVGAYGWRRRRRFTGLIE